MWNLIVSIACLIALSQRAEGWIGPSKDHISGGNYYYISEEVATQVDGARVCRLNGWTLASVLSRSQQRTIMILARDANVENDLWIGLQLFRSKDGDYGVWSDGKPFNLSKDSTDYSYWHPREPITYKTSTQITMPTCVRLWKEQRWSWDDYYCNYTLTPLSQYVCQAKGRAYYDPEDHLRISKDLIKNTKEVSSNPSNLESISNAINELLGVDDEFHENDKNTSRDVLNAFDEFIDKFDVEKSGAFRTNKTNVEIKINLATQNDSYITGETEIANNSISNNNIQIYLSSAVLNEAITRESKELNKTIEKVQISSIFYRNPALFQVNERRYKKGFSEASNLTYKSRVLETPMFGEDPSLALVPVLISDVLSVDIKNVNMTDLKNPICVTNYDYFQNATPPEIPDMKGKITPICAFWNITANEWSTNGCRILKSLEEERVCGNLTLLQDRRDRITCMCDHMTHFSVLLDTTYIYAPKYLIPITIFGCTVSIICLFATIVTILSFKQLRSKTAQQILLQLCINLFLMNILFLVGIDRRDEMLFCTVIAAMLHYFLLAAWAWMFIEAMFLFLRLVVTSYNDGVRGKIVPVGGLMAYGFPGLIAGLSVGITRPDVYLSEKYCWLAMPVLIPSVLVPIALVLFSNLIIFVCVLYTITFRSKMFRKRVDLPKVKQTLIRAFCMIFILGIPWLFGFFMLLAQSPEAKEVFAICFTVLNTTQGVAIFFFFCARQEQVRKLWIGPMNQKFRRVVRRVQSVRKSKRESSSRHQGFVNDTDGTAQSDDTKTNTFTNERSPAEITSQTTDETNVNSANSSSGSAKPFRHGWS
uniref:adhesion G protein-coupled receptor E3-like n=1 Tax=Styela clava TaxID=7725 RepID=UPI00193962BF|nr:adhesion G protein-coupled receptor E3-like [Styela clava]